MVGDRVARELPKNLAWIHAEVSEKLSLRMTEDACATTVALLTKSSRANNNKKKNKTALA